MKVTSYVISLLWLTMLVTPSFFLIRNLTTYLMNNEFKEWHLTILWLLMLPITTLIIMLLKGINKKENR